MYKKKDENCDDEKMQEDLGRNCDRISYSAGGLITAGEYELVKRDNYFHYVNELAARVLYWHTKDPEAVGIDDD